MSLPSGEDSPVAVVASFVEAEEVVVEIAVVKIEEISQIIPELPVAGIRARLKIKVNLKVSPKVNPGTRDLAIRMPLLPRSASPIGPLGRLRPSAGSHFLVLGSTLLQPIEALASSAQYLSRIKKKIKLILYTRLFIMTM